MECSWANRRDDRMTRAGEWGNGVYPVLFEVFGMTRTTQTGLQGPIHNCTVSLSVPRKRRLVTKPASLIKMLALVSQIFAAVVFRGVQGGVVRAPVQLPAPAVSSR
uniref:Uncharacterized protein n=1 Tax=Spongospora subterranea TaxID=70186 RepID=A0A0H5QTR6_9EUKA|eukprot:CRZ05126.1 hypothetical protein [Spongospora subterranea]